MSNPSFDTNVLTLGITGNFDVNFLILDKLNSGDGFAFKLGEFFGGVLLDSGELFEFDELLDSGELFGFGSSYSIVFSILDDFKLIFDSSLKVYLLYS